MSKVLTINDPQFATEVIESPGSVLVYFWAPWCGPCRLMAPMVESIASEYGDRLKIVKMEVDPNPEAVAKCKVEGVPMLVIFKDGEPVETLEGVVVKQQLQTFVSPYLPQEA